MKNWKLELKAGNLNSAKCHKLPYVQKSVLTTIKKWKQG